MFEFSEDIVCTVNDITGLEFYVVIVAVNFWAPHFADKNFIVSCDNEAAVTVINSRSTRDSYMQFCLRQLRFKASVYDFDMTACHIPGYIMFWLTL